MLIGVVTALRQETSAALTGISAVRRVRDRVGPMWRGRAGAADVVVVQSGVGVARAEAATTRFALPPDLIVSIGFAGALRPHADVGTLVVCTDVVWEDGSGRSTYQVPAPLVAMLREAADGPRVTGSLLSSPTVLTTCAEKAAAGERYDAAAVEMEGAALARYAARHDIPFLPIRAILDPMELSLPALPPEIGTSWSARARLVAAPALWPKLRLLHAHAAKASDVLGRVSRRLFAALATSA